MLQRFLLDRRVVLVYLALTAGCTQGVARTSLLPVEATPLAAADVAELIQPTLPVEHRLHQFKWKFRDEKGDVAGRGSVRIAPPDSIRFDAFGPLGTGKVAAMAVGDQQVWVAPEKELRKLVPNYQLLWGMFGIARAPGNGAAVRGARDGTRAVWQYADGADTVEYERRFGERAALITVVREAGTVVGRAETALDASGQPVAAKLDVPSGPARLNLTFTQTKTPGPFKPDTWSPPEP